MSTEDPDQRRSGAAEHVLDPGEGGRQDALRRWASSGRHKRQGREVTIGVAGCVAQHGGARRCSSGTPTWTWSSAPTGCHARASSSWTRHDQRPSGSSTPTSSTSRPTPSCTDLDPDASEQVGAFRDHPEGLRQQVHVLHRARHARRRGESSVTSEIVRRGASAWWRNRRAGDHPHRAERQQLRAQALRTSKTFAELLYAVAEVQGVERIRYTTSHPRDMGDDVVQAYRDLPQPHVSHLHLPVQSGLEPRMLRRMKRF